MRLARTECAPAETPAMSNVPSLRVNVPACVPSTTTLTFGRPWLVAESTTRPRMLPVCAPRDAVDRRSAAREGPTLRTAAIGPSSSAGKLSGRYCGGAVFGGQFLLVPNNCRTKGTQDVIHEAFEP